MTTFTDAELDALWDIYCEAGSANGSTDNGAIDLYDIEGMFEAAAEMRDAITYLRDTLKSVLQREAETYARHDAKVTALEAQLSERDPIGAAVMRERAAAWMDSNAADLKADASRFRGGTDPHHYRLNSAREARQYADAIRTLPLPTPAETLAHALQLPEIKALLNTGSHIRQHLRDVTFSRASAINPPMTAFISLKLPEQAIADYDAALAALEPKP